MTLLPPTPAQRKRMDKELPPDPDMRERDIRALREWLSKQSHLPNHIDDGKLGRFLYNCKNSIERCKLILERYYTVRTSLPEFFTVRDPLSRDIQDSVGVVNYFVLPSLTEEGYRVSIFRLRDTNVEKFSFQAIVKRILMILDARLWEESCLSNIMIIDLEFHIHNGDGEELYAYMDKDILPNEWGGKAGTFQELNAAWQEKIEKNRDWFLRDEKLSRTNEKARLPESKRSCLLMELEGTQGSFRKLNID
ncbi:alpha-tocopherol transfer protein-like isoform X2 [Polyergus mexicanus]|uniref:alpha-tocopherol transfer protein-like isoform X2 n=1 Tax=Polyergus mexicanus TaxID=615972 RepID=UPI0038B61B64